MARMPLVCRNGNLRSPPDVDDLDWSVRSNVIEHADYEPAREDCAGVEVRSTL